MGIVGGIYAGNKAASAQRGAAAAANNRLGDANRILEESRAKSVEYLSPYSELGRQALSPLSALMFGTKFNDQTKEFEGNLSQEERMKYFQESPGYQYQLDQGISAIDRSAASAGMLQSGNTLKELQGYGQDMANQEYGNYINSLLTQLNIGSNADSNISNVYQNTGQSMSGNFQNMANYSYAGGMANAQKYSNMSNQFYSMAGMGAQGVTGGGGGGGGGGASPGALSLMSAGMMMSDINLKENIVKVGEEKGFNIYEFNYKGQPEKYQGVMAQEVQKIMPEAVVEQDGHLAVLYDKIGIEFKKL